MALLRDDRYPAIQPHLGPWRSLDLVFRACFPTLLTVFFVLALAAPLGLPGQAAWQPAIMLGCVFFWTLYRPQSMPPLAVFVIGLLFDLLGSEPLGLGSVVLLMVQGLVLYRRRELAQVGFLLAWLVFAAIAAGAATLVWIGTAALRLQLLPLAPALFQLTLIIGLYPPLALLLDLAHRGVAAPEAA